MKRVRRARGFCSVWDLITIKLDFVFARRKSRDAEEAPAGTSLRRLNFYSLAKRLESCRIQRRWTPSRRSSPRHLYERCGPRGFLPTKREIDRRSFPETLALENPPSSRKQMAEGFQTRRTRTSPRRWLRSSRLVASSETLAELHDIDES